jgi:hypothetical protein
LWRAWCCLLSPEMFMLFFAWVCIYYNLCLHRTFQQSEKYFMKNGSRKLKDYMGILDSLAFKCDLCAVVTFKHFVGKSVLNFKDLCMTMDFIVCFQNSTDFANSCWPYLRRYYHISIIFLRWSE